MIFVIIQPALFLHRHETVAIPLMPHFARRIRAFQKKWRRPFERRHLHSRAAIDHIDLHPPVARMRRAVIIAIIHQRLQRNFRRRRSSQQRVLHVRRVFSVLHPYALFQQRIRQRIRPHRRHAFQTKTLDAQKSFRIGDAAHPLMRRKRVVRPRVANNLIHSRNQLHPSNRRLQCRNQ